MRTCRTPAVVAVPRPRSALTRWSRLQGSHIVMPYAYWHPRFASFLRDVPRMVSLDELVMGRLVGPV